MIYLGYEIGEADGKFGANTEKAVRAIQKKWGLVVDGKVGELTKQAIEEEVKAKKQMSDEDSDSLKTEEEPEFSGFISSFMLLSPS